MAVALRVRVARQVGNGQGAWANERHRAAQHEEEFREFVEGGGAEKLAKRGQTLRVAPRPLAHRAKLDEAKRPPVETRAHLRKENGTPQKDTHEKRDDEEESPPRGEEEKREGQVERALHASPGNDDC